MASLADWLLLMVLAVTENPSAPCQAAPHLCRAGLLRWAPLACLTSAKGAAGRQ